MDTSHGFIDYNRFRKIKKSMIHSSRSTGRISFFKNRKNKRCDSPLVICGGTRTETYHDTIVCDHTGPPY